MRYGVVPQQAPARPGQRRRRSAAETAAKRALAPSQARRATAKYSCCDPDYRCGPARRTVSRARRAQVGVSFLRAPRNQAGLRFGLAIPPARLPLMWCLVAFILTFFVTRTIVRYIRAHAGSDAPRKWWQPRNIGHGTTAHPPRGDRCDLGHGLRGDDGDVGGRWGSTRIHGRCNLFRHRCGAGARRVRADPAPGGRVLGRGRPHVGGRGVRRGRGGGTADPGLQPVVVLRRQRLARRPLVRRRAPRWSQAPC